ncbi:TraR/DksA family transcriptional regulator [Luteimicrobium subarcticum]|uniref:TraR/DksA family transcriptional regulator n=1 Tax=Luteimicrobium subarcticum TaxID=620910 RepID=A0A2M8WRX8_9MICO|nr:TraR/DksA family transcriptional regulator [Luteimicrobium subarcticum]PJI93634.1 TraR/DksA family transcriptional regulator [Luteimicrobium subarcticum]
MPTDDDRIRDRLLALRAEAVDQAAARGAVVEDVTAARQDSNVDDEHDPEGVTLAVDRAQALGLVAAAQARVVEADAALARLDAGTYGVCERCGRPVGADRLAAHPTARRCVTCQEAVEREQARA